VGSGVGSGVGAGASEVSGGGAADEEEAGSGEADELSVALADCEVSLMIVESGLDSAEDAIFAVDDVFADPDEELRDATDVYSVVLEMLDIPDEVLSLAARDSDIAVLSMLLVISSHEQIAITYLTEVAEEREHGSLPSRFPLVFGATHDNSSCAGSP
jgi:hypothetical protein